MSLVIGGTLLGADSLLAKQINWEAMEGDGLQGIGIFSAAQIKLLNEIAETILPATPDSPGAKEAKTGQFIAVIVSDCYEREVQEKALAGLEAFDAACKARNGKYFMRCNAVQRHDYLVELDEELKPGSRRTKPNADQPFFRILKDMVLWGYFTSEIGATKALHYVETPGKYTTIDYKKGDGTWM
jgi:hypothetical protein